MAGKSLAKLELSERRSQILQSYSKKGTAAQQQVNRVKIILKSSEGQSKYSISQELGMNYKSVSLWRTRWEQGEEELSSYEKGIDGQGVSDTELLNKMLDLLKDKQRSGAPPKFNLSQQQQIVAVACRKPSEYGIPINKWTHAQLQGVVVSEKIVESISVRQVGNILKKSGGSTA